MECSYRVTMISCADVHNPFYEAFVLRIATWTRPLSIISDDRMSSNVPMCEHFCALLKYTCISPRVPHFINSCAFISKWDVVVRFVKFSFSTSIQTTYLLGGNIYGTYRLSFVYESSSAGRRSSHHCREILGIWEQRNVAQFCRTKSLKRLTYVTIIFQVAVNIFTPRHDFIFNV